MKAKSPERGEARGVAVSASGAVEKATADELVPVAEPRQPCQERGMRRVDCILDAAAAIIAEDGIAGATMHRVARCSGATVGSMYHFFPDRETLLRALVVRHTQALNTLAVDAERDAVERWSHVSTAEAVSQFLDPFMSYVDANADLLPLMRFMRTSDWAIHREQDLDRTMIRLGEALVLARNPGATPVAVSSRAVTIMSMAEGVVYAASDTPCTTGGVVSTAALRQELRRALVAYLDSCAAAG